MTREIIKQVPYILENPVLVLKSQNSDSRLAIFGEVTDKNGAPVTAILELQPTNKGGQILDMSVIASAYGKDSNPAGFIMNSGLVYIDANKKRTKSWLHGLGLQLPSDTARQRDAFGLQSSSVAPAALGSVGSITYPNGEVKIESVPTSKYIQYAEKSTQENSPKKYSTRDPDLAMEFEKVNQSIETENEYLREDVETLTGLVELQKQLFRGNSVRKSAIRATAKVLMEKLNVSGETAEFTRLLDPLYDGIASGSFLYWEDIENAAQPTVDWLVENMKNPPNIFDADLNRQEVLMEVYDGYWQTSTMYTGAAYA